MPPFNDRPVNISCSDFSHKSYSSLNISWIQQLILNNLYLVLLYVFWAIFWLTIIVLTKKLWSKMHNWVSLTFGQLFSLTGLVSHTYSAWKTVPISSLDYRAYINIRWWQIHWAIFLWAGSSGKYTMQTYIPKQLVKEYKGTEWNRIQQNRKSQDYING